MICSLGYIATLRKHSYTKQGNLTNTCRYWNKELATTELSDRKRCQGLECDLHNQMV